MLEASPRDTVTRRAPADFQDHLANLEAAGLLVRIDRAINKDTELHPLVRWQFQGGLPKTSGAPSCSPMWSTPRAGATTCRCWSARWRPRRRSMRPAWAARWTRSARPGCDAIANPIPPVAVTTAPCQEMVITGDDSAQPRRRAGAAAGAGIHAGLRCRALSHRDAVHHRRSRHRRAATWAPTGRS